MAGFVKKNKYRSEARRQVNILPSSSPSINSTVAATTIKIEKKKNKSQE